MHIVQCTMLWSRKDNGTNIQVYHKASIHGQTGHLSLLLYRHKLRPALHGWPGTKQLHTVTERGPRSMADQLLQVEKVEGGVFPQVQYSVSVEMDVNTWWARSAQGTGGPWGEETWITRPIDSHDLLYTHPHLPWERVGGALVSHS